MVPNPGCSLESAGRLFCFGFFNITIHPPSYTVNQNLQELKKNLPQLIWMMSQGPRTTALSELIEPRGTAEPTVLGNRVFTYTTVTHLLTSLRFGNFRRNCILGTEKIDIIKISTFRQNCKPLPKRLCSDSVLKRGRIAAEFFQFFQRL